MARLWTSGAELQPTAAGIEYTAIVTTAPAIETSTKRSGNAAFRIANTSAIEGFRQAHTAAQGSFFFRFYLYVVAFPTTDNRCIGGARITGSNKIIIKLRSSGELQLYNAEDSAQIGSDSSALSLNTWYRVEITYDSTTLSSTTCSARIDGTQFASGTVNLAATPTSFGCFTESGDATMDYIVDDMAINDTTGSFQTSWPGDEKVIVLRPNGNGDNSGWTGSDGNSTDNYLLVDEVPPTSTDYVQSNTSGQIDDYNLEATPAALGSGDTINVVQVGIFAATESATSTDPDVTLRIKAAAAGTVEESASLDVNSVTFQGPAPLPADSNYKLTLYDLPGGSTTAWTKSDLDTAQIGVRESATDANFVRVGAIWLTVGFTPASGTQYTQDASGGMTPSGAILKEGRKVLAGTLTDSGTVNKSTTKTFAGSLSSIVGTLTKQSDKVLSGALSSIVGTLTLAKTTAVALSGAITPSGTLSRLIDKILGSTLTSSGSVEKQTTKSFTGDVTPTGGLLKQINKTLSGAITSIVGTLEKIKLSIISLGGSLELTGTITKQTNKTLSGDNTPQGSLLKSISKSLSGTITSAGELLKSFIKTLSGDITPQGSIVKSTSKSFTGDVTPTGAATKQSYRVLEGSITPTGSILKSISKFFAGVLTWAGDLIVDYIPAGGNTFFKTLTGELTSSGTVQKNISKLLGGALEPAGALLKSITKTFSGTLVPTGALLKSVSKFFSGTLSSSGTLDRSITFGKILAGTLTSAGTLIKSTAKSFSGVLTPEGSILKAISKLFSGTLSLFGTLEKGVVFLRDLAGTLTSSGSLIKTVQKSLAGSLTPDGSISKAISITLSGSLTFIGQVSKSISKFFSGVLSSSGLLTRIFNLPPANIPKVYLAGKRVLYVRSRGENDSTVGLEGERVSYESLIGEKA